MLGGELLVDRASRALVRLDHQSGGGENDGEGRGRWAAEIAVAISREKSAVTEGEEPPALPEGINSGFAAFGKLFGSQFREACCHLLLHIFVSVQSYLDIYMHGVGGPWRCGYRPHSGPG